MSSENSFPMISKCELELSSSENHSFTNLSLVRGNVSPAVVSQDCCGLSWVYEVIKLSCREGMSDQGKTWNWQVSEVERWKKATIGWEKKM